MTIKSITVTALTSAVLFAAAPAFARGDHDDWNARNHHGRQHVKVQRVVHEHYYPREKVIVERKVVVYREAPTRVVYREAPTRVVYREAPPQVIYREPPPVYGNVPVSYPEQHSALGTIAGAAAGAVVGSRFGKGDGRTAAIAIGTVLGAMVGNTVATAR